MPKDALCFLLLGCICGLLLSRRIMLIAVFDIGWICGRAGWKYKTARGILSKQLENDLGGADLDRDPRK